MEGSFTKYEVRVSAVIFGEDARLLVVQHSAHGRTFWTFPGGSPDLGESLRDAVVREVREETGYTIEHGDVIAIGELGGSRWEVIFQGTVDHTKPPAPRPNDASLNAQWRSYQDIEHNFAPAGVLFAATDGRFGRYLGNITDDLGGPSHED